MSHTRFKKGVSGNPNGRPKGAKSWHKRLEDKMREAIQDNYVEDIPEMVGELVRIAKGGPGIGASAQIKALEMTVGPVMRRAWDESTGGAHVSVTIVTTGQDGVLIDATAEGSDSGAEAGQIGHDEAVSLRIHGQHALGREAIEVE